MCLRVLFFPFRFSRFAVYIFVVVAFLNSVFAAYEFFGKIITRHWRDAMAAKRKTASPSGAYESGAVEKESSKQKNERKKKALREKNEQTTAVATNTTPRARASE